MLNLLLNTPKIANTAKNKTKKNSIDVEMGLVGDRNRRKDCEGCSWKDVWDRGTL